VGRPAADPADGLVTATIRLDAKAPVEQAPGSEFNVIVKLAIKPGWHIYANPTGVAEVGPSRLELHPESRKLVTIEQPVYPAGVVKVLASSGTEKVALYEKEAEIKAACKVAKDATPGSVAIKYTLSYQACNDNLCRAPALLEIPLTLKISGKASGTGESR
jgi:DsbC/DsbD-like thiol-disulfide interchange protein